MRLPGDAYEKIHELNPEEGFGKYGPLDRFMILADVAPQSEQYDLYRNIVQEMNTNDQLDDTQSKLYEQTRDQVVESRKKYNLEPYKFKHADINKETVTVTEVVDPETFYTKEYPNNPMKMAGIDISKENEESASQVIGETVKEGARIEVGLDADPLKREGEDIRSSMEAVVYSEGNSWDMFYTTSKGQSLNARVARMKEGGFMGLVGGESIAEKDDDGSATATRALYDDSQVTMGKAWEWMTHTGLPETPIFGPVFDKFISSQSPLEAYKDKEIYGKSFKSWGSPMEDWVEPMMQTAATKNPMLATAQGAGFGSLFGGIGSAFTQKRGLGKMKVGTYYGGMAGGIAFGATASIRAISERIGRTVDDEATYIPKRIQKEREVNEYYDRLKYVKYKGLYNRAAENVEDKTGVDLDQLLQEHQEEADKSNAEQAYLEESKSFLQRHEDMGFAGDTELSNKLKEVRDDIAEAEMPDQVRNLGPDAMQALQYKQTYESTLHGADPYGDFESIFRALPDSDREFYEHFMNAAPEEREEILRLVPDNQKKFYQARWGMDVEEPESNKEYFSDKNLPSADWGGWSPENSLEAIKVKTVKNEALDLKEFNLWEDAEKEAAQTQAPRPGMDQRPSMMIDTNSLTEVLRGKGLTDAEVTMQVSDRSDGNRVGVGLNLARDRTQDFVNTLNNEIGSLLSQ